MVVSGVALSGLIARSSYMFAVGISRKVYGKQGRVLVKSVDGLLFNERLCWSRRQAYEMSVMRRQQTSKRMTENVEQERKTQHFTQASVLEAGGIRTEQKSMDPTWSGG